MPPYAAGLRFWCAGHLGFRLKSFNSVQGLISSEYCSQVMTLGSYAPPPHPRGTAVPCKTHVAMVKVKDPQSRVVVRYYACMQ